MLKNLEVKRYLSRLMGGRYVYETSNVPAYPTLDVTEAKTENKTGAHTITIDEVKEPTIFTNTTASIVLTLPKAKDVRGGVVRAYVTATETIQLEPATGEKVNYNGNDTVDENAQIAGVVGNYMEVVSDGDEWVVTKANGVVTKV